MVPHLPTTQVDGRPSDATVQDLSSVSSFKVEKLMQDEEHPVSGQGHENFFLRNM